MSGSHFNHINFHSFLLFTSNFQQHLTHHRHQNLTKHNGKPSTMPYEPDSAKANIKGITYRKNSLYSFILCNTDYFIILIFYCFS